MIVKSGVVHSNAYRIFICELIVSKIVFFSSEKYFVFKLIKSFTLKMSHVHDNGPIA